MGRYSPEKNAWYNMIRRCSVPTCNSYKNYGGRGISVCERWMDFDNFFEDMGNRPSSIHSLDRINNDGNYEPSNCKWSTKNEQMNNRRKIKIDYDKFQNKAKNNTSGYRGIAFRKNKWEVEIFALGDRFYLGTFKTIEEALRVRKEAEEKYWPKSS